MARISTHQPASTAPPGGRQVVWRGRRHIAARHRSLSIQALVPAAGMQEPGAEAIERPASASRSPSTASMRRYSACAQMRRVSSRTAPFSASAARTPMASTPWRRAHCARAAGSRPVRVRQTLRPRRSRTAIQTDGRAHAGCPGFPAAPRTHCVGACTKCWNALRQRAPAPVRPPARRPGRLRSDASWDSGPGRARAPVEATAASYRPSGREASLDGFRRAQHELARRGVARAPEIRGRRTR